MNNYEVIIQIDGIRTKVNITTDEEITKNDYDLAKEIAFDALWEMVDVEEVVRCLTR